MTYTEQLLVYIAQQNSLLGSLMMIVIILAILWLIDNKKASVRWKYIVSTKQRERYNAWCDERDRLRKELR
jgi:hypothetical protein